MLAIISPAMNMKEAAPNELPPTTPHFLDDARSLASRLRAYSPWELESLLRVNPSIALRAHGYYQDFEQSPRSPALLAFYGLAYQHLRPQDFTKKDLGFAQNHLRILSALYGLLRPGDGIAPYRLDFMGRLRIGGRTLYSYWGARVCRELFRQDRTVLNLCSGEYTKLVAPHLAPGDRFLSCRFLVRRRGSLRCLATESKAARGEMARYLVKERIDDLQALPSFSWNGYCFVPELSSPGELVFVREG